MAGEATKWLYTYIIAEMRGEAWEVPKEAWDSITALGDRGWELVSVCPITVERGQTSALTFFLRLAKSMPSAERET